MKRGTVLFMVKLLGALSLVAAVGIAGADVKSAAGGAPPDPSKLCSVTGNVTLDHDPANPTRVAFVRTDGDCRLHVTYEILSEEEFAALNRETGDDIEEGQQLPEGPDKPQVSNISPEGTFVSASPLLASSSRGIDGNDAGANAASLGTKKVRGHHKACHQFCFWPFEEVEVKSEFRWWYNGSSVTGWSEGLGTRKKFNSCWSFGSLFQVYWDTSQVPYGEISVWTKASFTSSCGVSGGWLRVQSYGHYNGAKSVNCSRSFSGPWPTVYACWISYI
jgi:hypothetical protein